jgi:TamB, inner membrane protein subunit of TAM complex
LFLIIAVWVFIQTPLGQNWISRQVTKRLSRDLQTKISIRHVNFSLFNKMHLQGVLIEDRSRDTLLYAGDVQVKITDWFFFKKEAELKYIGLEDAIIKFQRTDSIWRQQFLFDYFASPSTDKKKEAGIRFDLKKVDMKNVTFLKKDGWLGQDIFIHTGGLDLDANEISLSGNTYDISKLNLTDPVVSLHNYPGLKPKKPRPDSSINEDIPDSVLTWNAGHTIVKIGNLKVENGIFKTDQQVNRTPYSWFDGQNIFISGINGEISDARFIGDSVFSKLKLSAKERSGLELKNLTADLKVTPKEMTFSNLDIATNKSTIRNSFSMRFDDFSDMDDFIHKVTMTANFENSEIDSDDIAFFAPALKSWKKKIILKGKVRGTVDDLVGKDMIVQAGNSTSLNGDINLTGLPDINQTFIDFKANDFKTTYSDAVTIVPAMRRVTNPDLRKIQYLHFQGSFTGFVRDFVTFGTIQTNLGTVKSDLNMKLPSGQEPVYSGNISTDNFNLGEFLGDPKIGSVSMTGLVKGKGFNEKNRNAIVDGKINFVDYNNYRYNDITLKGKLDKKLFDGDASINDENARITLKGIIDLNGKIPAFNFLADVQNINLKNLHLSRDSLVFKGKLNLDFTGNNIDDFLGTARISEARLTKDGNPLSFDSLTLSSSLVDNKKILTASSNEFSGTISGDYHINDLPNAFQLFLNKYYPAYIKPPKYNPENESFHFDITTKFVEDYIKLADSSLSGFNYSHLYGDLNLRNNQLDVHADIPQFKYKQYNFDDVKLTAKDSLNRLLLSGETKNININDSLNIPLVIFKVYARNDSSRVNIYTSANKTVDKADVNALVLTYTDGVKIEFDPSSFTVNGKTWSVDENGELEFRSGHPVSGQLMLREGDQRITLKTQPSLTGKWNDLKVELAKMNIGDFSRYLLPRNRLEGLVSGNILIEDPTHNDLKITSDDIKTDFLRLDNDSLGEIKAGLSYDNVTKELKVKGNTLNEENYLAFDADLFLGSKEKQKDNIIALKPKNFEIKVLDRFLGNLFSDMQGYVTGNFDLKGDFQNLNITGKGRLKDAGLKVNFTQCFYKILDTDIELRPSQINLDGIVLTDPITGNHIYVNGNIQHQSFRNMFYDLYISTRKPNTTGDANNRPVLLLNTSYKDNQQFYGKVKGTGSLSLTGQESEMFMKIDAIASNTDSSNITIPPSNSRETGIADFLVERKYGHEMSESGLNTNTTNIIYDVDIRATPLVNVKVVLDELTGDEIKGKGSGNLNIRSGTSEPLTIRGRYDIEEGNYLFTFKSIFKKPFELRKGANNYIEWNGDPYKAQIHFDAVYTADKVSFAPLVTALNLDPSISKYREDVYVVTTLTGELFKPEFKFRLAFPSNAKASTDPSIAFSIQQMEKNENEINRQVTYLIVFNSFAPIENTSSSGNVAIGSAVNELTNAAISSLSGMFFNVINRKLNSELSKILKTDNISINFSGSLYNRNLAVDQKNNSYLPNQSDFNVNVPVSFFKDRFIVTFASTFDVPLRSSIQQSVQILPDVTAEWLINPSGSIRASFFYRQNIDYLTSNNTGAAKDQRAGAGISYRKDFDRLGDIFKKRKTKPTPVLPPEEKTSANKDENVPKQE